MTKKEIVSLLNEVGIPSHLKGYNYLFDCMMLFSKGSSLNYIYNELSSIHNTSTSNIERSIRYSIEIGYSRGNYNKINDLFGNTISYNKDKPTNKHFIYTLLDI